VTGTLMRALLVDDEPLARRRLRTMLSAHADVSVIAECEDAERCVQVIREVKPELVFLDIQMPGADGFDVVDRAQVTPRPFIIFVTAFAQHAVRAFDTDAVDYLLKPYDDKRLARALERARSAIAAHGSGAPRFLERLAATIGSRTVFIKTDEIDWIEASGNYVNVHTGRHTYLLRTSMGSIEARLDPAKFARVHRSAIVRIDRVLELRSSGGGDYKIALSDGSVVPMSARYRDRLR
jgi:two-component system, LytTR family, response regulator